MTVTVQSIIDRVTYVTKDDDRVRWSEDEIVAHINDAQALIAEADPRSCTRYVTLTLAAGARQDLRTIDNTKSWIRLFELVCNVDGSSPTGDTIRQVHRPALDFALRTWRSTAQAEAVKEFAMDEREPFTFDVYPPVSSGVKVHALAAYKPTAVTADGNFNLTDGYDVPTVDYVLSRLFAKDANDPTYTARADRHLQAFSAAVGIAGKDAAE